MALQFRQKVDVRRKVLGPREATADFPERHCARAHAESVGDVAD
jgi:hypothetical protein